MYKINILLLRYVRKPFLLQKKSTVSIIQIVINEKILSLKLKSVGQCLGI